MPIEIIVPRLGWSMEEGQFGQWLKQDGEWVEAGAAIFTLESDKALQEVESIDQGVLHILPGGPQEGDTVQVGLRLGFLLAKGERVPDTATACPQAVPHQRNESAAPTITSPDISATARSQAVARPRNDPTISPRAARVAREMGIDWTMLTGTGATGRIRERDVRAAASSPKSSATERGQSTPVSSLRKTIAQRMMASVRNTAPVTLTMRLDATQLVNAQNRSRDQPSVLTPSYSDFIAHAAASVLRAHPLLNSRWEGEHVVQPDGINIGIAVDTEAGLLVPVIHNAHQMTLEQLVQTSRDLVTRARSRQLAPNELAGGTFTITNLGAFGIEAFTPIINVPETAILGIGCIRREPAVVDDRIEPRDQMTLSLTFDHRVVDGAPAARFLQTMAKRLETIDDA